MIQSIDPALGEGDSLWEDPGQMRAMDRERLSQKWEMVSDIVYAHREGKPLKLDLFQPKEQKEEKLPGLVYIHGGGWNSGSKKSIPALFAAVPGYIKISIDYQLAEDAPFPAPLQDCKTAIRWFRSQSEALKLDPDRIGVWGSSAGGHLASLLAVTQDREEGEEYREFSSRVQAVVSCSGPADLEELWHWKESIQFHIKGKLAWGMEKVRRRWWLLAPLVESFLRKSAEGLLKMDSGSGLEKLMGIPLEKNRERWRQASPIYQVKQGLPPFLLLHGTSDPIVPVSQAYAFHEALRAAGAHVIFAPLPGLGHNVLWDHNKNFRKENAAFILAFLQEHLQGKEAVL